VSFPVNVRAVCEVLLADGWHRIIRGSLRVDVLELVSTTDDGDERHIHEMPNCFTALDEQEYYISGPLSAVILFKESDD
jgi:hypothetical protein